MKKQSITINGKEYTVKKSRFCVNASPVHVSDSMSGKMAGVPSISTSCLLNPICQARMQNPDSICAHCYAAATLTRYTAAGKAMESNYHLLSEQVLPLDLLPVFANVSIVRIESFGDVGTYEQAVNYANIARLNQGVMFAWWTKNAHIVAQVFADYGKPKNVLLIESSEFVNVEKSRLSEFTDKVFTVYDAETIEKQNVSINCGARSCATCRRCYSKETETTVNEKLK